MPQFIEKRPTAVSVVGWFWIIVGGFIVLTGVGAFLGEQPPASLVDDVARKYPVHAWVMRYYSLLLLLLSGFGLLAVFFGIGFLRLRKWARTALEVISWLALTGVVAIAIGMVTMTFNHLKIGFLLFTMAFVLIGTAFYWVPLGLVLRALRSKKVRDAVSGEAGSVEGTTKT